MPPLAARLYQDGLFRSMQLSVRHWVMLGGQGSLSKGGKGKQRKKAVFACSGNANLFE